MVPAAGNLLTTSL